MLQQTLCTSSSSSSASSSSNTGNSGDVGIGGGVAMTMSTNEILVSPPPFINHSSIASSSSSVFPVGYASSLSLFSNALPTLAPTPSPTLAPSTSSAPPPFSVTNSLVYFSVSQALAGFTFSSYQQNSETYKQVLVQAIVDTVNLPTIINKHNVQDLQVMDVASSSSSSSSRRALMSSITPTLTYNMYSTSTDPKASYDSLSACIASAAASNDLTVYVSQIAKQMAYSLSCPGSSSSGGSSGGSSSSYNASCAALQLMAHHNITFVGSPSFLNLVPSMSSSHQNTPSALSQGAAAGLVISLFLGLFGVMYYYFYVVKKGGDNAKKFKRDDTNKSHEEEEDDEGVAGWCDNELWKEFVEDCCPCVAKSNSSKKSGKVGRGGGRREEEEGSAGVEGRISTSNPIYLFEEEKRRASAKEEKHKQKQLALVKKQKLEREEERKRKVAAAELKATKAKEEQEKAQRRLQEEYESSSSSTSSMSLDMGDLYLGDDQVSSSPSSSTPYALSHATRSSSISSSLASNTDDSPSSPSSSSKIVRLGGSILPRPSTKPQHGLGHSVPALFRQKRASAAFNVSQAAAIAAAASAAEEAVKKEAKEEEEEDDEPDEEP